MHYCSDISGLGFVSVRINIKGDVQILAPAQNFTKRKKSSVLFDQVDIHEINKPFIINMFYNNRG